MTDPRTIDLFPFACEWNTDPVLTLRARTRIDTADTGREERTALLSVPAVSVEFDIGSWHDPAEARRVEHWMRSHLGEVIAVPLWTESVRVTGPVSAASIPVEATLGRLLREGGFAVLWAGPSDVEVFEVATVATAEIIAAAPINGSFGPGARVAPVIVSEPLTATQIMRWISAYRATGRVKFSEEVRDAVWPFADLEFGTFRAFPIFPFQFDADPQAEMSWSRSADELRCDSGAVAVVALESVARLKLHSTITLDGRFAIGAAFSWFRQRLGRLGRFWLPTGKRDFELPAGHAGGTSLTVSECGYTANDFPDPTRRHILVWTDAAWYARRIFSATRNPPAGTETLTLDSPLPPVPATARASLLVLARSELDDCELSYTHTERATMPVEAIELPTEYVLASGGGATGLIQEGVLLAA